MLPLNAEEFQVVLMNSPIEAVVEEYVFGGTPHVFRENPETLDVLFNHLSGALEISEQNMTIVGSAKIGFSLSPDAFPRQFSEQSDIDVLIVDESLFDKFWMAMLGWHYPRKGFDLGTWDNRWVKERRKDLYWGWFRPDKVRFKGLSLPNILKPLRDISTLWFDSFQSLSRYPQFANREVSGRLYRTWDHALLYHVHGLRRIREVVHEAREGV